MTSLRCGVAVNVVAVVLAMLVATAAPHVRADEWETIIAECDRLVDAKKYQKAKQLADKGLSLADASGQDSSYRHCTSGLQSARVNLALGDNLSAITQLDHVFEILDKQCRYKDLRASIGSIDWDDILLAKENAQIRFQSIDKFDDGQLKWLAVCERSLGSEMLSDRRLPHLIPEAFLLKSRALRAVSKISEAEQAARNALNYSELEHGAKSIESAMSYGELAMVYAMQKQLPLAVAMAQRGADICDGIEGEKTSAAAFYEQLAGWHLEDGDADASEIAAAKAKRLSADASEGQKSTEEVRPAAVPAR